jgi:hypothetical protein
VNGWASWAPCRVGLVHLPVLEGHRVLVTRCQRSLPDATARAGMLPDLSGQQQALCGRWIPAAGLALSGPSARFCTACVAEGTTR